MIILFKKYLIIYQKNNINNYKDFSEKYSSIELEIIPIQNKYGHFINIKRKDKNYFHIYFNENKKETKKQN